GTNRSNAGTTTVTSGGAVAVPSGGRLVRVALAVGVHAPAVSATGPWVLADAAGGVLVHATAGSEWTVEEHGSRVRARGAFGGETPWIDGPLVARPESPDDGFVRYAGHRYRGALWLQPASGGVTVVNRVAGEEYLRGVLPLELPTERAGDHAALEAQAVTARSYLYSRIAEFLPRTAAVARAALPYDVRATTEDQLYGGVNVEQPNADRALLATTGLVLRYDGAVVSAPYYSACGGSTADPSEVWGAERAPYLRRVVDSVPGEDRAYCDIAPRAHWERSWDADALDEVLARYLRRYAVAADGRGGTASGGALGAVREWRAGERTPSGRTASVTVTTDAGRFVLRGNAIRFAMRSPLGRESGMGTDILPSTYFSAVSTAGDDGRVLRLVLHGRGNGHGVGMCQWGAIGRARAGQDFRHILQTYYPGTTVEPVE
ncbi:MAG TPA: SpoIID/LytB domain-containing protein, partial [Gemmatirosa sp.]